MSAEEKALPYYKYFEQDLAPIPAEKLVILAEGPGDEKKAVPFERKDLFLAGMDEDYCQTGYGVMDDGTGFVCNTTYMPGVTGEMLDRMRTDCEYLLGPGARLNKYLWARDPQLQIVYMKALWNSFPEGQKPEWLSFTRICQLERQMMAQPGQNKEDEI